MTFSPFAISFFSYSPPTLLFEREFFLCKAQACLSDFDYSLLYEILIRWESSFLLSSCFSIWISFLSRESTVENFLHILSFNVRDLDLRIQEILLLISSFNFDLLILLETGLMDFSFCRRIFSNFNIYYQKGENSNGGLVIMVRNNLKSERICCSISNVCVVGISGGEDKLRIKDLYAAKIEAGSGRMFRNFYHQNVQFMEILMAIEKKIIQKQKLS